MGKQYCVVQLPDWLLHTLFSIQYVICGLYKKLNIVFLNLKMGYQLQFLHINSGRFSGHTCDSAIYFKTTKTNGTVMCNYPSVHKERPHRY